MLTQQPEFSVSFPTGTTYNPTIVRAIAAQPGSDSTVAIYPGISQTIGVFDFDATNKTATQRGGQNSFNNSNDCFQFLDPANLLDYENVTIVRYGVSPNGISPPTGVSSISNALNHFGCFKLAGGLAFANAGGLADATPQPAIQLGTYPTVANFGYSQLVAPDTSLNRVFFLTNTGTSQYSYSVDGIVAYDELTFLPSAIVPLNIPAARRRRNKLYSRRHHSLGPGWTCCPDQRRPHLSPARPHSGPATPGPEHGRYPHQRLLNHTLPRCGKYPPYPHG